MIDAGVEPESLGLPYALLVVYRNITHLQVHRQALMAISGSMAKPSDEIFILCRWLFLIPYRPVA